MEFDAGRKYLNILLDHIFDILFINQLGVNHAEHVFVRILDLLREDKELKNWFFNLIRKNLLVDEQDMTSIQNRPNWFIDPDLILFIAHATKWEEFKAIAEERKEILPSLRTLNNEREFSDLLINALYDDWEDSDFYNYFCHK